MLVSLFRGAKKGFLSFHMLPAISFQTVGWAVPRQNSVDQSGGDFSPQVTSSST